MVNLVERQITVKASARKSHGEYKPMLVTDYGAIKRTEMVSGGSRKTRERGTTFKKRSDAIAHAQSILDARIKWNEDHKRR